MELTNMLPSNVFETKAGVFIALDKVSLFNPCNRTVWFGSEYVYVSEEDKDAFKKTLLAFKAYQMNQLIRE